MVLATLSSRNSQVMHVKLSYTGKLAYGLIYLHIQIRPIDCSILDFAHLLIMYVGQRQNGGFMHQKYKCVIQL